MSDPREKRRFERVEVHIPVGIYVKGAEQAEEGEIVNISEGGAYVKANVSLEMNQEISIELRFKGANLFGGKVVPENMPTESGELSTVRWTEGPSGSGFGIEFNSLSDEKREFIGKLIDYYRLLQEDED